MKSFSIGQKVYQQGTFDIYKCEIVEYIPNHSVLSNIYGRENCDVGSCNQITVDAYKVKYGDGTMSVVPAGNLSKSKKGMYQL